MSARRKSQDPKCENQKDNVKGTGDTQLTAMDDLNKNAAKKLKDHDYCFGRKCGDMSSCYTVGYVLEDIVCKPEKDERDNVVYNCKATIVVQCKCLRNVPPPDD